MSETRYKKILSLLDKADNELAKAGPVGINGVLQWLVPELITMDKHWRRNYFKKLAQKGGRALADSKWMATIKGSDFAHQRALKAAAARWNK